MKFKKKNFAFLLVMGLIFPLTLNYSFNFSNYYKPKIDNLKTSGSVSGILIDALATTNTNYYGNWTWARTQTWCTQGNGTKEYPYIIKNLTIIYPPVMDCLKIINSRKYFTVRNCTFKESIAGGVYAGIRLDNVTNGLIIDNQVYDNSYGIYCTNVNNSQIIDNNCTKNVNYGIIINTQCINNSISNNIVEDNVNNGIYCGNQCNNNIIAHNKVINHSSSAITISEDYNIVFNNTIKHNYIGLEVISGDYNNISENVLFSNSWSLSIDAAKNNDIIGNEIVNGSTAGIFLWEWANNNTISDNKIINSSQGIVIGDMYNQYNIITKNLITNCTKGILIQAFENKNNTIYQNTFINNGIHAEDNMGLNDNKWDNGTIGNYWDDYLILGAGAVDANDDGIGDIPYTNIAGSANSQDNFPIWDDGDDLPPIIIINSPSDYSNHTVAPTFSITIMDQSPIDNRWYVSTNVTSWVPKIFFTGNSVTINETLWNNLINGTVTIRFFANDSNGNVGYKDAYINKVPPPPENDNGDGNGDGNGDNGDGQGIPGYHIIVLISILSIITIIHKTKKNLNNN